MKSSLEKPCVHKKQMHKSGFRMRQLKSKIGQKTIKKTFSLKIGHSELNYSSTLVEK